MLTHQGPLRRSHVLSEGRARRNQLAEEIFHDDKRLLEPVALPNESRLSCGATLKYSQMEFYHTVRRTFTDPFEDGRRQLQALLGCAPQVIARVLPFRGAQGALTVAGLPPGL